MRWIILLLFLVACEPDIIYIEKQTFEHPGLLEIHNELFDGTLHIKTDGRWIFADTLYTLDWFTLHDVRTFSLDEGGYRLELIHEGVGRYSSGVSVFRDSIVIKVIK